MYDKELAQELLKQILEAADRILFRFKPVKSVSFFTDWDNNIKGLIEKRCEMLEMI